MQMTFAASGQGHALFIRVVACDLLRREGWDSMSKYQEAGREVFIVRIEIVWGLRCLIVGRRGSNWPGRRRVSAERDMHRVCRGCVHGQGVGVLARRRGTCAVVLVDVLGRAKRRMLDHVVGRPSSHRLPCHGGRMKIVGGLPSLGGFDSPIVRKC
ncbi:hypothetical protein CRG98_041357 [Punica granatum]|uniref:Uncharacterized protein n=1 Tax=Punica granatum TaxID=22663 RepID=A0A2I0I2Q8_PUNGR|nr:hypothetical protein CRG98_041357 [Punica granatum]